MLCRLIILPILMVFAAANIGISQDSKLNSADTLVFCPDEFRSALKPWLEYRTKQGHKLAVVAPPNTATELKIKVRETAKHGKLKNVVLVGDSFSNGTDKRPFVPTDYVKAEVNVVFGAREPEIATDNSYADTNSDGIPDLVIGRIPVDTAKELKKFTERVFNYESAENVGSWQRRINFVAGVGGFGKLVDTIIEQTTKQIITELVPADYATTMTYGSWTSPYCPDPRKFASESIKRFNEGCMFWVYIGHGARHRLDKIYFPDSSYNILDLNNVHQLKCSNGSPIAIFLACYTGATDHPQDCLAEEMLRQPGGPIATICGTRVTMPYAMSLLSLEMVNEFFYGSAETMGQLFMLSKQRMISATDKKDNFTEFRTMIRGMGQAFTPKPGLLKKERYEHVHLIHYLGDPLLRVKRPSQFKITVAEKTDSGKSIKVSGIAPVAGQIQLEVCYKRDRFRFRPKRRRKYERSDEAFDEYQATYEKTQDMVCVQKTLQVEKGKFEAELDIPLDSSGECVVRAMLIGKNKIVFGSSPIEIQKTRTSK